MVMRPMSACVLAHPQPRLVREQAALLAVEVGDHGRQVVGDVAQESFARLQALLGRPALPHERVEGVRKIAHFVVARLLLQGRIARVGTRHLHVFAQARQRRELRANRCKGEPPGQERQQECARPREALDLLRPGKGFLARIHRTQHPVGLLQVLERIEGMHTPAVHPFGCTVQAGNGAIDGRIG
jgi:hypothetical protein